jgi:hypothetical protein
MRRRLARWIEPKVRYKQGDFTRFINPADWKKEPVWFDHDADLVDVEPVVFPHYDDAA